MTRFTKLHAARVRRRAPLGRRPAPLAPWPVLGKARRVDRRDADGYYWFVGRADEVIKSAGHLLKARELGLPEGDASTLEGE